MKIFSEVGLEAITYYHIGTDRLHGDTPSDPLL